MVSKPEIKKIVQARGKAFSKQGIHKSTNIVGVWHDNWTQKPSRARYEAKAFMVTECLVAKARGKDVQIGTGVNRYSNSEKTSLSGSRAFYAQY